jgi:hypothetical protein
VNDRGHYGTRGRYGAPFVGNGSIFPHTPTDTENELDELHSEIMQFGAEIIEKTNKTIAEQVSANPEVQRLRAEELAAYAYEKTQTGIAAVEAVKKSRAATVKRADAEQRLMANPPLLQWKRSVWDPFSARWLAYRSEKKDIPLQMWPMSGTWNHIQDERQKLIEIRRNAPFKATGPAPIEPRKDPSITDALGDIGKIAKWGIIGILGIGGVVLLSSVVSNVRTGKDPAEKYVEMIREGRRSRKSPSRTLPQAPKQRALPSGPSSSVEEDT